MEEKRSILSQLHAARHEPSPKMVIPPAGSQIPVDHTAMSIFDPKAPLQPHLPTIQSPPTQQPMQYVPMQYVPVVSVGAGHQLPSPGVDMNKGKNVS